MEKILTVAIPTYNRAKYLDLLLSGLLSQVEDLRGWVDIVISDNCSTDGTREVVRRYSDAGLSLRYLRNQQNMGATWNTIRCFEEAQTKYVLVFGDDDILLDGTFKKLAQLLSNDDYGAVYLKSYSYLGDHMAERPANAESGTRIYDDPRLFFRQVNFWITFLSGIIVNKRALPGDFSPRQFESTSVPQLAWVIPAALSSKKNACVLDFCVAAKQANTGGYQLCSVFGASMNAIFDKLVALGAPKACFDEVNSKLLTDFFPINILLARKGANFKDENYFESLAPIFSGDIKFWVFVVPVIRLPLSAAAFWRRGMNFVLRGLRKIGVNI
ncbi:MAG: hypothetical protein A2074_04105 [Candidatus Aquicultor primus]|uniref:Glycosyltransferase 2-like domain-containing protein n=1 Tax=Candidatus Aquicultor primus TaxID=1797195 RepID=A0A1F2URN2_9ACTN|nr:MAG: hypothetical protein A2074_04105 [Candidatus Aquicultor primus]